MRIFKLTSELSGSLVNAGVDWITATATGEGMDCLRDVACGLADVELHSEMYGRPWSTSGYEGFAVGHVQYGERQDGCIIRLGGECAASHWQRVFEFASNVTRLDVQATYRLNCSAGPAIQNHYSELLAHSRKQKRGSLVSMLVKSDGARTVYSGSRSSMRFGRIYDKGLESGLRQYERCVRYEMELKGKRALGSARLIRSQKNEAGQCAHLTHEFFSNRGLYYGRLLDSFEASTFRNAEHLPARATDVSRQVDWLKKSVSGSLKRVIEARGFGEALMLIGVLPVKGVCSV